MNKSAMKKLRQIAKKDMKKTIDDLKLFINNLPPQERANIAQRILLGKW